jgi:hypothetical protein
VFRFENVSVVISHCGLRSSLMRGMMPQSCC